MIPGSANLLLATAGSGTYRITRSLRFNSADSTSLSRTIADGDRRTFTWAGWVKRSGFAQDPQVIFVSGTGATNCSRLTFTSNSLSFVEEVGGVPTTYRTTTAVYRDPAAWMHIVLAVDTNQGTPANRIKLYVNGTEVTVFSVSSNPTPGQILQVNAGTFYYGRSYGGSNYLDAYLADVHFINGLALTPTSFGEFEQYIGRWNPIRYTGSYGVNGHKLTFSDNSNTTAATLGADTSGNGNNFTPTSFAVTGATNDCVVDSPTSYGTDTGLGGEVRGNYCTLNPISTVVPVNLTNGNLDIISSVTNDSAVGTFAMFSGSWYWEVLTGAGANETRIGVYGTAASTVAALPAATAVGVRFNATTGALDYTINGLTWTSIATGLTSGPYVPYINTAGTTLKTIYVNFGQRPFIYTAPSGYKALCDTNMSAVTIYPDFEMDVVLYTGTGSSLTLNVSPFLSPDLVWFKSRSTATDHAIYDTVRGATLELLPNNVNIAETTQAQGLTAFNTNGFTIGSLTKLNTNNSTYVAWCWNSGSSTVTNTSGTISSQVRANPSAGISIVTYTGNGVNQATVGHGLGVAPQLTITRNRGISAPWIVMTTAIDGSYDYLVLNTIDAKANSTDTAPTSAVVYRGTTNPANINTSGGNFVMYCFAPVVGFSAFGSYVGNGSANGPFVLTGFRPKWIMLKSTGVGDWFIFDSYRSGYNADNDYLAPSSTSVESSTDVLDITSNGFKLRNTPAVVNGSATTIFYAAFAEFPFQYARAR